MRAAVGAIEDVKITEQGVKLQIIVQEEYRQEKPEGVCGSGILAVVKELRRTGLIRKDGAFIKPKDITHADPSAQCPCPDSEYFRTGTV